MFNIGDIVRLKDGYKGMVAFNYLLNSKETHKVVELCDDGLKVEGSYFLPNVYFEIIKEVKQMFDMKVNAWYILINNQAEFDAAQAWLEENFGTNLSASYYKGMTYLTNMTSEGKIYDRFVMHGDNSPTDDGRHKEIKLSFVTTVKAVEYPEVKSPSQVELESLQTKISELQEQAEKLQGLINK